MRSITFLALGACLAAAACGEAQQGNEAAAPNEQTAAAAAPANGSAPAANAAESIRTRQTHYKNIGKAMKGISDELKKDAPAVATIQTHAATINGLAPQVQGWFPDGSGSEAGLKTEAKAEIWAKPEEFKASAAKFVTAAAAFHQTAQAGDLAAIRTGVKNLGGSCKGCHDQFRVDD
jgi:cytochrome c556